jgi:hypothetical protein
MMSLVKRLLGASLLALLLGPAQVQAASVHVRGYTKRNGTYVAPHYRSAPRSHGSIGYRSPRVRTYRYSPPKSFGHPRTHPNFKPKTYRQPRAKTYSYRYSPPRSTSRHSLPKWRGPGSVSCPTCRRDSRGRFVRSGAAHRFMRQTGYPHGRPGYVVDHVIPLACGGRDDPSNMQWETIAEARAKDRYERRGCR